MGDYFFQSQYQQEPFTESGGDFKKEYFQYYDEPPKQMRTYSFLDPAISEKQDADQSAIVTV